MAAQANLAVAAVGVAPIVDRLVPRSPLHNRIDCNGDLPAAALRPGAEGCERSQQLASEWFGVYRSDRVWSVQTACSGGLAEISPHRLPLFLRPAKRTTTRSSSHAIDLEGC
jgi:hypothetical protein